MNSEQQNSNLEQQKNKLAAESQILPWQKVGAPQMVLDPTEAYGKFAYWQNFRNPKTEQVDAYLVYGELDCVAILAITDQNEVIIVRQYRQGYGQVLDEVPMGGVKKNVAPLVQAEQELLEETGYKAERIRPIGVFGISPGNSPTRCYMFLATGCRQIQEPHCEESEVIEMRLVSLASWQHRVRQGEIEDAGSAMVTLMAEPYLKLTSESSDRYLLDEARMYFELNPDDQ